MVLGARWRVHRSPSYGRSPGRRAGGYSVGGPLCRKLLLETWIGGEDEDRGRVELEARRRDQRSSAAGAQMATFTPFALAATIDLLAACLCFGTGVEAEALLEKYKVGADDKGDRCEDDQYNAGSR